MFSPALINLDNNNNKNHNEDEIALEDVEPLIIGLHIPQEKPDACWLYQQCYADGYTFCTTQLPKTSAQSRTDVTLLSGQYWHTSVVGVLDDEEHDDWEMPLEWAWHMGLPVVIVPKLVLPSAENSSPVDAMMDEDDAKPNFVTPKQGEKNTIINYHDNHLSFLEYARKIGQGALHAKLVSGNLWIPLTLPNNLQEASTALQQWSLLNRFLHRPKNIGLLLDMKISQTSSSSASSPSFSSGEWGKLQTTFLHHLIGEGNIRGMRFHCSDFSINKSGHPALSRGMQFVMEFLLKRLGGRLRVLVQGPPAHHNTLVPGATHCLPYFQYLQHVRQRLDVRLALDSQQARLEEDHCDHLQRPLQPLRDHLNNDTYEIFEKDTVKYREYQKAISLAFLDFAANTAALQRNNGEMQILVVGAGRGPLISCVMRAFELLPPNRRPSSLSVCAVEKNPCAIIYLSSLIAQKQAHWSALPAKVQLVQADLRVLTSAQVLQNKKADLVVSELLGSFGDNELSPECLDALFHDSDVCHDGTVSIPMRYTAYLAPVSSIKLHQEVTEQALFPNESEGLRGINGEGNGVLGGQVAMETPYVVRPRVASQMGASSPCWTFEHPRRVNDGGNGGSRNKKSSQPNELNRTAILEFDSQSAKSSPPLGCGYGPVDEKVMALLEETAKRTAASPSLAAADSRNDGGTRMDSHPNHLPWTLTGFLGTFSADLYVRQSSGELAADVVRISTVPETYSKGMFSWFPLYFPLENPLTVPAGEEVVVRAHISRHSLAREMRVWYEWSAVVVLDRSTIILGSSPIQNPRGRSFFVSSL